MPKEIQTTTSEVLTTSETVKNPNNAITNVQDTTHQKATEFLALDPTVGKPRLNPADAQELSILHSIDYDSRTPEQHKRLIELSLIKNGMNPADAQELSILHSIDYNSRTPEQQRRLTELSFLKQNMLHTAPSPF